MLKSTEEHRKAFPKPPFIAFRRRKDLKYIVVRLKLYIVDNGVCDSRQSSPCRKSRCQVCNVLCSATTFLSCVTNKEYRTNFSLNFDSSDLAYMLECGVCGLQYVGSTCTPFRVRCNNYKSCTRRFNGNATGVPQTDIFRHFAVEGQLGFL